MKVTHVRKARTMKAVTIDAPQTATKDDLVNVACEAAGEARSSLFGWQATYFVGSENWVVNLYTD